jgi:hypothetical protein
MCTYPVFPIPFVEKAVFPPMYVFTFVKNQIVKGE